MNTGDLIKEVRLRAGLTQAELAERLGVTPQAISQYERGIKKPKYETIRRIADAVGCSPFDLIPDNDINSAVGKIKLDAAILSDKIANSKELSEMDEKENNLKQQLLDQFDLLNDFGKKVAIYRLFDLVCVQDYSFYASERNEYTKTHEEERQKIEKSNARFKKDEQDCLVKIVNIFSTLNSFGKHEALRHISEIAQSFAYQRPAEDAQTAPSVPDDKDPDKK